MSTTSFSAKIWNMLTDHDAHYLYLEIRDEEEHQVSFAAYALSQQKLLWRNLSFEENWWIGMQAADKDVLVFHTYEDSDNPEKKAHFAIDIRSQQPVWSSALLQVLDVHDQVIYGYELNADDKKAYKYLSLKDHAENTIDEKEISIALQNISVENKYIRHPFHYTEEEAYFATVRTFVQTYMNLQVYKGCEYLEHADLIFISYYIQESSALANYLLVIDQNGTLQLHEKLDDQLSQIGIGTFMIIRDQLIFIKRKRELVSYAI
ncbi:DUF4905 domain-containing protein [Porifericola rhodea]|uniref:DUF4905 domain-containing protein n=1 Tax=Porifericola rhodea TaxID=930972 RepID=UPI002665785C|nr:DUF4905 domain-containing protein [Porifericola rhodea]WKN32799.1 DUF4905 domain-containing protein [Porifericola rhodea]